MLSPQFEGIVQSVETYGDGEDKRTLQHFIQVIKIGNFLIIVKVFLDPHPDMGLLYQIRISNLLDLDTDAVDESWPYNSVLPSADGIADALERSHPNVLYPPEVYSAIAKSFEALKAHADKFDGLFVIQQTG